MTSIGIDGNWVLHRAVFTQNHDSVDPAAAIVRKFVSMISRDALFVKATKMVVAFDGSRVFRYGLYKDYKANRDKGDGESPYDYLAGLIDYLGYCGIATVQIAKYEADDVLCSLAATAEDKLFIATRDKDAYQYLRSGVALVDSTAKPEPAITKNVHVKAKFGVQPHQCVDLQTLIGDKIDNVPMLLGRAAAVRGLTKHGSLKAWLAADAELRATLKGHKEQLSLNRKLVKLVSDIKVEASTPKWRKDEVTLAYSRWRDFCNPRSRGLF